MSPRPAPALTLRGLLRYGAGLLCVMQSGCALFPLGDVPVSAPPEALTLYRFDTHSRHTLGEEGVRPVAGAALPIGPDPYLAGRRLVLLDTASPVPVQDAFASTDLPAAKPTAVDEDDELQLGARLARHWRDLRSAAIPHAGDDTPSAVNFSYEAKGNGLGSELRWEYAQHRNLAWSLRLNPGDWLAGDNGGQGYPADGARLESSFDEDNGPSLGISLGGRYDF